MILVILTLALCSLAFIQQRWARRTLLLVLALAALEWIATGVSIAQSRLAEGGPWLRAAVILGSVAALNGFTAWLLVRRQPKTGCVTLTFCAGPPVQLVGGMANVAARLSLPDQEYQTPIAQPPGSQREPSRLGSARPSPPLPRSS